MYYIYYNCMRRVLIMFNVLLSFSHVTYVYTVYAYIIINNFCKYHYILKYYVRESYYLIYKINIPWHTDIYLYIYIYIQYIFHQQVIYLKKNIFSVMRMILVL